jgi:hypothetical protein
MPNFKRSSLGLIIEDLLYLTASERGYEAFGKTKEGTKMVISFRRKDLDGVIADAAKAAKIIANMRKREVRLDFLSERIELFYPEDAKGAKI